MDAPISAETLVTASRNVVGACAAHEIQRLVVLTIAGIEDPTFDGFPYYEAKRVAKEIVLKARYRRPSSSPPSGTNSPPTRAVSCNDGEVVVEDWLIQPIAADSVADVLVEAALGQTHAPRTITGPQAIRLPELTSKLLALPGDGRRVRAVQPPLTGLAAGALLAPTGHGHRPRRRHLAAYLAPDSASIGSPKQAGRRTATLHARNSQDTAIQVTVRSIVIL